MWRGQWIPTAKQVPSGPKECPPQPAPSFSPPEVPSRPPTSRPKPYVPCPGTAHTCDGPSRGHHSYPIGKRTHPAPFILPLLCDCQEVGQCSSVSPSATEEWIGHPAFYPCPQPLTPGFVWTWVSLRSSKDQNQNKKTKKKKTHKITKKKKAIKNLNLSENYYLLY